MRLWSAMRQHNIGLRQASELYLLRQSDRRGEQEQASIGTRAQCSAHVQEKRRQNCRR